MHETESDSGPRPDAHQPDPPNARLPPPSDPWAERLAAIRAEATPPAVQAARRAADRELRAQFPGEYVAYTDSTEGGTFARTVLAHDASLKVIHAALAHLSDAEMNCVRVTHCARANVERAFRGGYDGRRHSESLVPRDN
jgi:hypothetical protein